MRIELEKYRDYSIFYETMYDRIEIESLESDEDSNLSSIRQAKFKIDKHLKEQNKFEPFSKRFSLANVKACENFNRRNTLSILRIKICAQR